MIKNEFMSVLERGTTGKFGTRLEIEGGISIIDLGEATIRTLADNLCLKGMYHSLLVVQQGWGTSRVVNSLLKRDATWTLNDTHFEYTALFDCRTISAKDVPDMGESQAANANDIDLGETYDRYVEVLTTSEPILLMRLTIRGDYSSLAVPQLSAPRRFYGDFDRMRSYNLEHRSSSIPLTVDCDSAGSYGAGNNSLTYSVEILDRGSTLRVPSLEGRFMPTEEPYTGWMPSVLTDEIISEEKTGLFSIWKLPITPKATSGDTLHSKVEDNLLHITVPIELTYEGTIYSIPSGVYFVGRDKIWKDSIAYDDWLSTLSKTITIKRSTKKGHLLISLEDMAGPGRAKVMKNIKPIKDTKDGPTAARGGSSKITKM
jgi:hypothetical protein